MTREGWKNYWSSKGHSTKSRVENYRCLDCSWCYDKRERPLQEAWLYGHQLKFCSSHALVTLQHNGKDLQYKIPVVATECNYGGQRHWFLCPLPPCRRRSKKLYLHPQGVFVCRKCIHAAYCTQNRSKLERIIDKKWKLIHELGGDSEFIMHKPKKMHWKTFDQLRNEIWRLNELADRGIALIFGNPLRILG